MVYTLRRTLHYTQTFNIAEVIYNLYEIKLNKSSTYIETIKQRQNVTEKSIAQKT